MIVAAPDGKNIDFGDLPPDQVTSAMQRLYPPTNKSIVIGGAENDQPEQGPDSSLGHQLGLTARYPLEALATPAALVGNAANSLINAGFGTNLSTNLGDDFSNQLTKLGLPQSEGQMQRIVGDASRGVAGAGMSAAASQAANLTQMAARPIMQMISGATGGASAGATREAGGGPILQTAAGMLGGMTPYALSTPIQAGYRGMQAAVEPLYQGGREKIVGRAMNQMASNPQQAMQNMGNAPEFVPGSQPTTAEAAGDYGLMSMQKGVKNQNPEPFAQRASEQNTARNMLLNTVAQHDAALQAAKSARDVETGSMREGAFNQASEFNSQANLKPVTDAIDSIANSPEGSREMVSKAMNWVKQRLDVAGSDPASLYEVRKDINDAMQGKFSGEASNLALAKSQLKRVKDALDQTIESGAAGYKNYLNTYREHSIPINQMETAQEIKGTVMQSAPDTTGYDFISQPKWSNVVQANRAELSKKLAPEQLQIMDNITSDLDRGATLNNSAIKPAGSDTFQNMSLANVLGSVIGNKSMNPLTTSLGRAYSFLYKLPDQAINKLVVDAMLDPRLARQMMQKATNSNVQSFGEILRQRALASSVGSFMGTQSAVQQ